MRKYFLFFREQQNKKVSSVIKLENDELKISKLRIGEKGKIWICGEKISVKAMLIRLVFAIITFGKTYIYYCVNKKGEIVHTSCVVSKCVKFSFLSKNDYEIGPCVTIPKYRGKGIYSKVLDYIVSTFETEGGSKFYMIISPSNKSSIKGVEKAKFQTCGEVIITKFKQYKRSK